MQPYELLEKRWAEFNDLDPSGMVACSSGTAALHLALEALQLPSRSEVIVPNFTMIACARAVTLAGLIPVFMDCDEQLLMDINLLSRTWQRQAIMAVHVYGRRCDMERIAKFAKLVIEDLAEAHGVKPHPQTDAACWSFYKNKIVAGEEGGAVWFKNPEHAALARKLRSLGFTDSHDFNHISRGHNYRMSNLHAAVILERNNDFCGNVSALDNYQNAYAQRREYESWYERECPAEWRMPYRDAPWVYDIRIPGLSWVKQCEIVIALGQAGIQARFAFKPMSLQEEYQHCRKVGGENARKASVEVLYLPLTPGMVTEESAKKAFEIIQSILKTH